MLEPAKDQMFEEARQAHMRRLSYMTMMELSKDEKNKDVLDHPTLHGAITAIKKQLAKENRFLDEMESFDKYNKAKPPSLRAPVDLRRYDSLEKVMESLAKDEQLFPLVRRCILVCQPDLHKEILQLDPTVSEKKKNELSKKYFARDRTAHFEKQISLVRKEMESFDQYERYKAFQRLDSLLKGKMIPMTSRREDLGYCSQETLQPNQTKASVSMETLASNSFAVSHLVSSKKQKKKNAKPLVMRDELDESGELVISCTKFQTVPEESNVQNVQHEERAEKLMKKHRYEAGVSYERSMRNKRNKTETIDYLRCAIEKNMIVLIPPKVLPEVRVRRKILEGSYPNWTVIDDKLPRVLRYTWKGKLKKLKKLLSKEERRKDINKEDTQGRTALHYASSWGCIRTLQILIRIPNIQINARDEHGKTPLYKAVEIDSTDCVETLIALGANVLIPAYDTRDPITYSLTTHGDERFDMFKLLYQRGDYGNEGVAEGRVTLLHKAMALCEDGVAVLKCVHYMLAHGKQDVDAKEADGRTPVHLAAMFGRDDLLRILLAFRPNIFHMDNQRKTAYDYEHSNKSEIHRLLDRYVKYGPLDGR
ncbi:uncharacterized protein [Clytia hemisphaerica]|uniref:Uncharacterized protein n=1 Tax=Clytia hemisphaerica TaxID=252671 RepID=A0A7M5WY03_9CNID